jgi:hypothetical protein
VRCSQGAGNDAARTSFVAQHRAIASAFGFHAPRKIREGRAPRCVGHGGRVKSSGYPPAREWSSNEPKEFLKAL